MRHVAQLLHAAATAEQLGTTALTSWLRRRIAEAERDTRRRGAQPPAGVRRRGRPGAHHPPQQGARVPDRLLPVPVGDGLRAQGRAGRVPRSRRGRPAHARRRPRGRGLPAPQAAAARRGARRGPAARLRRADAGAAPGRGVVGGLVRQPQLAARAAAVRPRRRRATSPPSGPSQERRRGGRAASRRWPRRPPGCISVERAARRARRRAGRARRGRRPTLSASRFERELDRAGAARPTATSPPARTSRASGSEPEEPRRRGRAAAARAAGRRARRRRRRAARRAVAAGRDAGRRARRHVRAPGARAGRLRGGRPRTRSWRPRSRRRGGTLEIGDAGGGRRAGCARRWRPRSGRCWAGCGCATCGARTGSTSSTFELPLAGGDAPTGRLALDAIAAVLRAHLPPGDPLAGYADRLADPALRRTRARLPHRQHRPRRADGRRASRSPTTRRTGSRRPARS